jgi:hypothetical protein
MQVVGWVKGPLRRATPTLDPANRVKCSYLYDCIADWARSELGLHGALVRGSGSNKTNLPGLRN